MEQTCHTGGTGVGFTPFLQNDYAVLKVSLGKVYLEVFP